MLSRSSFKAELIVYRSNLKPPRKPGDRGPLGIGNRNSADLQLLAAWIDDPHADGIWRELKKRRSDIDPATFIKAVLAARRSAQASVNREYGADLGRAQRSMGFNEEWAKVRPAIKTKRVFVDAFGTPIGTDRRDGRWVTEYTVRIQRRAGHETEQQWLAKLSASPSSLSPLDVAQILEWTAADLRNLHRHYFGFSDHLGLPGGPKFKLSRKNTSPKKKTRGSRKTIMAGMTRVRRLFIEIMREWFFNQCGRRMNSEAVDLAEIAFPGPGELSAKDAANIRKIKTKS